MSIDDRYYYALLDLSGYSRYGFILGLKSPFWTETAYRLATYTEMTGRWDINYGGSPLSSVGHGADRAERRGGAM